MWHKNHWELFLFWLYMLFVISGLVFWVLLPFSISTSLVADLFAFRPLNSTSYTCQINNLI